MEAKRPLSFREGIVRLLKTTPIEKIGLVGIPMSGIGNLGFKSFVRAFNKSVETEIPAERIWEYTPPRNVGNKYRVSQSSTSRYLTGQNVLEPRQEAIPSISDSELTIVIYDHIIEKGHTLYAAIQAIKKQGIPLDRIWAKTETIVLPCEFFNAEREGYLDQAEIFLRYVEENSLQGRLERAKELLGVLKKSC
jgi:hypothetical protein